MHLEFTFITLDGEITKQSFDLTQLGLQMPLEGDCYILPDDPSNRVYEVQHVVRALPSGTQPYQIHVVCGEVQQCECGEEGRDLWQQLHDAEEEN